MHHVCKDMVAQVPDGEQILESLKTGRYTFLVGNDGNFIHNHMDLALPDT